MTGPVQQDGCLERIVTYFGDVHAELLEHQQEIALLNKALERLTARFEAGGR